MSWNSYLGLTVTRNAQCCSRKHSSTNFKLPARSALQRLGYPLEEHFNITLKLKRGMLGGIEHLAPASTGVSTHRDDAWLGYLP
jgi:hypothetical protein